MSTAWHSQTDDMFERTNQTSEIALRYYISILNDETNWLTVFVKMLMLLNNSTNYSFTEKLPTEILYKFKIKKMFN